MKPIITKLAGVTFGDALENIRKLGGPDIGGYELIREPNNPHDPNAIRVAFIGHYTMGYVPARIAAQIAPLMDQGRQLHAEFVRVNRKDGKEIVGITVRIVEIHPQQVHHAG